MLQITEEHELIALSKALACIKFNFDNYEKVVELAASPFIGELYKRTCDALEEFLKKRNIPYQTEWEGIETIPHYLNAIFIHISNTDDWNILSNKSKRGRIIDMAFPYTIKEETIHDLISKGDKFHSNIKNKILKLFVFYKKGASLDTIIWDINNMNNVPYSNSEVENFLKELMAEQKIILKNELWFLSE